MLISIRHFAWMQPAIKRRSGEQLKTDAAIGAQYYYPMPLSAASMYRFSIFDIRYPFTIGFMAGRRDFALVAPQSRNFHQLARRYQRWTRVFTFDISNTSILSVTPHFRMNLSTPSFDDIDMMSRKSYVLLETLRLEFTEKLLGKITDEKL